MKRSIEQLKTNHFDILVIGGGINGCAIARDASLRGARVALIEKNDFASGASGKTTKLIHGGIRYLEQFNFKLVFEALRERKILLKTAPNLVKPIEFIIPVYKNDPRSLLKIETGVFIYDLLAGKDKIRCHCSLSTKGITALEKDIDLQGLMGGVLYCDAQMDDVRLCLDNAISAYQAGCCVANKVEVIGFIKENDKVVGVKAQDKLNGEEFLIQAKVVINSTGAWSNRVVRLDDPQSQAITRPTKGVHIVYRKLPHKHAILISARKDKRLIFVIPWREFSLIGTTDTDFNGSYDEVYANSQEVEYLLSEAQRIFPNEKIDKEGIITTFAGLRPLVNIQNKFSWQVSREHLIKESTSGLISVVGGKYTTYRHLAEQAVDTALSKLEGKNFKKCVTAEIGPSSVIKQGNNDLPVLIEYAVKEEMANTLCGLLIRRMQLIYSPSSGLEYIEECAQIMAKLLGWDVTKKESEINLYKEEIKKIKFMSDKNIFCYDLPSKPLLDMGKILVTGASGYIGGRLVPELLARGYKVRVMIRGSADVYKNFWPEVEAVTADALNIEQLKIALDGIECAYYLIHSLHLGLKEFEAADIKAAGNFRKAAEEKQIKRIIYLGGLGDTRSPLSSHLRNRMEVAKELKKGNVPVTILRAAIIIGSGSASYEIIQHLVKKLPIIIIPPWAKNKCQPIAIRDVVKYLVGVLEVPETTGKSFDIAGRLVLTYERMLKLWSIVLHKKIIFIPYPFFHIRFFAYLASLLTPVPNTITRCLMEGLKNEVICQDDSIKQFISFKPLSFKESIIRAMSREDQDDVHTRWSDAYPPAHELALKLHELKGKISYTTEYSLLTDKQSFSLFNSICKIGGKGGWFHNNWMWRLRGILDRIMLGVGTSRGRKSYSRLKINDVIDFWRIEDLQQNRRLLLRAEMKLPGKAWLEFNIKEEKEKRRLSVIAYYDTNTFLGRAYWYVCFPFHHFIFERLIAEIEKRS